jgi:hypothetical protein
VRRLLPALLLVACSSSPAEEDRELAPSPPIALAAGEEIPSLCISWTLDNDEPLYLSAIDMQAGPGWHHAAWFHVPEDSIAGPDGVWDCAERGFDWAAALAGGGLVFGQTTQTRSESQRFPGGGALVIPPRARMVGDAHLINAGASPIETSIQFTLHAIDRAEASAELRSLYLSIRSLGLPPHARSEFATECEILHDGFALFYAMPHYHQLGRGMTVEARDRDGQYHPVFASEGAIGEPLGRAIDPTFDMDQMAALRISCRFDNPGDQVVEYGFQGEMCNLLAFTDSDSKWLGGAMDDEEPLALGERDGTLRFEVPCSYVLRLGDAP